MNQVISIEKLIMILLATPQQQAAIDRILAGDVVAPLPQTHNKPMLLMIKDAAALLGVSRATIWRMVKIGKLTPVEILPATFRIRTSEIEALCSGSKETH